MNENFEFEHILVKMCCNNGRQRLHLLIYQLSYFNTVIA